MRITNQMIVQRQLDGLQTNMAAIDKAQTQVSSGKRLTAASDDPTAATQIMSADSLLRALSQFKTNVQRASNRVATEDTTLQSLGDVLTRAREIAVQQGSETATPQTRAAAVAEVQGLLSSAVQLGNTKFGNEYLFGGDAATTAPFGLSGGTFTTTSPTGGRTIEINDGQSMQISHNGKQVFIDTGALAALQQLGTALASGDLDAIRTAITPIAGAFDAVQGVVGDVGARGSQLSMTADAIDAHKNTLTAAKSSIEDIDAADAITQLSARQTAYQAALLAVSKATGLSLTDYLK